MTKGCYYVWMMLRIREGRRTGKLAPLQDLMRSETARLLWAMAVDGSSAFEREPEMCRGALTWAHYAYNGFARPVYRLPVPQSELCKRLNHDGVRSMLFEIGNDLAMA